MPTIIEAFAFRWCQSFRSMTQDVDKQSVNLIRSIVQQFNALLSISSSRHHSFICAYCTSSITGVTDLKRLRFCETEWADGDSFRIKDQQGNRHTIRLYGVDCFEYQVADKSDVRRLRAQRRYFGISKYGGSKQSSITKAKSLGKEGRFS